MSLSRRRRNPSSFPPLSPLEGSTARIRPKRSTGRTRPFLDGERGGRGTGLEENPSVASDQSMIKRIFKHLRTKIFAGILVILPLGITFLVLKFVFNALDSILDPLDR